MKHVRRCVQQLHREPDAHARVRTPPPHAASPALRPTRTAIATCRPIRHIAFDIRNDGTVNVSQRGSTMVQFSRPYQVRACRGISGYRASAYRVDDESADGARGCLPVCTFCCGVACFVLGVVLVWWADLDTVQHDQAAATSQAVQRWRTLHREQWMQAKARFSHECNASASGFHTFLQSNQLERQSRVRHLSMPWRLSQNQM